MFLRVWARGAAYDCVEPAQQHLMGLGQGDCPALCSSSVFSRFCTRCCSFSQIHSPGCCNCSLVYLFGESSLCLTLLIVYDFFTFCFMFSPLVVGSMNIGRGGVVSGSENKILSQDCEPSHVAAAVEWRLPVIFPKLLVLGKLGSLPAFSLCLHWLWSRMLIFPQTKEPGPMWRPALPHLGCVVLRQFQVGLLKNYGTHEEFSRWIKSFMFCSQRVPDSSRNEDLTL